MHYFSQPGKSFDTSKMYQAGGK